jgi:hypothetical protein
MTRPLTEQSLGHIDTTFTFSVTSKVKEVTYDILTTYNEFIATISQDLRGNGTVITQTSSTGNHIGNTFPSAPSVLYSLRVQASATGSSFAALAALPSFGTVTFNLSPVPLPPAGLMLATAIGALAAFRFRRRPLPSI